MDASQELEAQLERERSEQLRLTASLETILGQLASTTQKLEYAERQCAEWQQRAESEAALRRNVSFMRRTLRLYRARQ